MRFSPRREHTMNLDMTPMIDIVFQLLIFFLVTAQASRMTRADMELPSERGEQSEVAEQAGLVINLMANGEIIVSDRTVPIEDLDILVNEAIKQMGGKQAAGAKVTVRADRRTPTEHLNRVVQRLHDLGVGAARIATAPPR
jgi:biopolymer transport protein ExbD